MAHNKQDTYLRLHKIMQDSLIPKVEIGGNRFVMISDLHLGNGSYWDNFRDNLKSLQSALIHYLENGYKLMLLGDIEELWKFRLSQIVKRYDKSLYNIIREFGENNVYRVIGNHDTDWASYRMSTRDDPTRAGTMSEAVRLIDEHGETRMLLLHGHQGSLESDRRIPISRWLVKNLFKKVEPLARLFKFYGHPSATLSQIAGNYEHVYYTWAREHGVIVTCGHSHNAIFASHSYGERMKDLLEEEIHRFQEDILANRANLQVVGELLGRLEKIFREWLCESQKRPQPDPLDPSRKPLPCYFNTGCGLYTDGLTSLEIADDQVSLAKWDLDGRRYVYDSGCLSSYIESVTEAADFFEPAAVMSSSVKWAATL